MARTKRDIDYDTAVWATEAAETFPEPREFAVFHTEVLGLRSATIAKHRRLVEALRAVPDREVWRAVGYPKVLEIARIADETAREAACRRAVEAGAR